jgi:KDO2-lipid IV(A) lauroyltransferase
METRPFKRAKRFIRYLLLRAIYGAVGLLPLRWAMRLGSALGRLGFVLARSERHKALESLSVAFPDLTLAERKQLARRSFQHMGEVGAELCCLEQIDPIIERYVELSEADRKLLSDALSAGRGVLLAAGHVGNFELFARAITLAGFPGWTVAKATSDPRTTAFLDRVRASGKTYTLWRGERTVFPEVLEHLRQGHIVGLVMDQDTRVRGVFVDFFARKAYTPRSIGDLALSTGAAVVAGFIWRRPDGGHRIELTRVATPRGSDPEGDVLAIVQEVTRLTEQAIRRAPHAWSWVHRRWKTRPPPLSATLSPGREDAANEPLRSTAL